MDQVVQRLDIKGLTRWAAGLTALGGASVIAALYLVFFYVPTERQMGIVQRIYYVHIPTAWIGEFAFGLMALCSLGYLMLRDDRLDMIAVAAAEIGFIFLSITICAAGPLWARVAWGTWWVWDARLSFSLLLWLIWLGYFLLRQSTDNPEQGKRFAAILAIVGAVDIPIIHMSVYWFRTQHPMPVVARPEGPSADPEIVITVLFSLAAYTVLFFGILMYRYCLEKLTRRKDELIYLVDRERAGLTQVAPSES